jgi:hypothetical protein
MPEFVVLLTVPGLRGSDVASMPRLHELVKNGDRAELAPGFPAVSCPAQANLTTGVPPSAHGVVANGFYWRDRGEVEMWTSPNDCILRPQLWGILHEQAPGVTSAVWFPLHSKNCGADYVCTPAPIHNPDGSESLWSGVVRHAAGRDVAMAHLASGLRQVLDEAERRDVLLGFEPEPGMLIDTMAAFDQLRGRVDSPALKLTLDVGHLHCQGEGPIDQAIDQWRDVLVNVHIEDMRRGVHEHLMFGEGQMDFPPIVAALRQAGYDGGVYVELSRHSHIGPAAARQAFQFLNPLLAPGGAGR